MFNVFVLLVHYVCCIAPQHLDDAVIPLPIQVLSSISSVLDFVGCKGRHGCHASAACHCGGWGLASTSLLLEVRSNGAVLHHSFILLLLVLKHGIEQQENSDVVDKDGA